MKTPKKKSVATILFELINYLELCILERYPEELNELINSF